MIVVQYPELLVTFNRALHEVLRPFFKEGGDFMFYGKPTKIHRCELHYARDRIEDPSDRPKIAILGDRPVFPDPRQSPGKCESGGNRVKVAATMVERVVHVIIPHGKVFPVPPYFPAPTIPPTPVTQKPGDKQMLDEVWQNLLIVIHGQRHEFRARGIMSIQLDHFPQEKSDEQYLVNTGRLIARVEYAIPTGFSPNEILMP